MEGELLSLKWNNHRSTFLQVVGNLRRCSEASYADATLACNGKFYPVHRLVLSSCSDYFNSIFDFATCKNPIIVLKDIESKNLEYLLDYMYIGEVNVRQTELGALVAAAECLKIKGLAVPDDDFSKSDYEGGYKRGYRHGSPTFQNKKRKLSKHLDTSKINNNNNSNNNNSNEKRNDLINTSADSNVIEETTTTIKCEPLEHEENSSSNDDGQIVEASSLLSNKLESNNIKSSGCCVTEKEEPVEEQENSSDVGGTFLYENEETWEDSEDRLNPDLIDFMSETVNSKACSSQNQSLDKSQWPPDYLELNSVASTSDQNFNPLSSLQEQFGSTKLKDREHNLKFRFGMSRQHFLSSHRSSGQHGSKYRLNRLGYRFFCHLCAYASKEKANLKRHMMTHTGEKPFKCPHCDYRSVAYHTIKRHLRTHTGEKPYVCSLCDYRCSTSETLRNHRLKHTQQNV